MSPTPPTNPKAHTAWKRHPDAAGGPSEETGPQAATVPPWKGDTVSVCTYRESFPEVMTQWLGYLACRLQARGDPFYTWTSAAVHVT